ncbi:acyl-CoA thioesterase [Jatrophihabitans sp. DSM 45814]
MKVAASGIEKLIRLLDIVPLGSDVYVARSELPPSRPTPFGGELMAQSLRAAAATTDGALFPHSLHASFLRAGDAGQDLLIQVERLGDGRSFSRRQVTARQGDRVLLTMTASFQRDEPSAEFQVPAPTVAAPPGDDFVSDVDGNGVVLGLDMIDRSREGVPPDQAVYLAWVRSQGELPSDRILHSCIMAYLSDMGAPAIAATAIGLRAGGPDSSPAGSARTTSLDHAMWFHRPGRCDDWLLVSAVPLSTVGSRGLMLGSLHDRSGRHLASFTQEMLIR